MNEGTHDSMRNQITSSVLRDACGEGAYQRGLAYFRQRRATLRQVVEIDDEGVTLLSTCKGSSVEPYGQRIIIECQRDILVIMGDCECPVSHNCKHVVAACLTWKAFGDGHHDVLDEWLKALESGQSDKPRPGDEALLYSLTPTRNYPGQLTVKLNITRMKRDGAWGKPRATSLSRIDAGWSIPRYLRPVDYEILNLLGASNQDIYQSHPMLRQAPGYTALCMMIDSGRCYFDGQFEVPLRHGPERRLNMQWLHEDHSYQLRLCVDDSAMVLSVTPPCYLDIETNTVGSLCLPEGVNTDHLPLLLAAPPVAAAQAQRISRYLTLNRPQWPTPAPVSIDDVREPPTPRLHLDINPRRMASARVTLDFLYQEFAISPDTPDAVLIRETADRLLRIHRDDAAEDKARHTLEATGLKPASDATGWTLAAGGGELEVGRDSWLRWIDNAVPELEERGWLVNLNDGNGLTLSRADAINAEVATEENNWFDLRFDLMVDGKAVPLLPLIHQVIERYPPEQLPDTVYLEQSQELEQANRRYVAVPAALIRPVLNAIIDLYDRSQNGLRLSRLDSPRLLELGDTRIKGAGSLQKLARRLRDFDGLKRVKPPSTFKGELREYQQHGLDWLQFLREYELGGILADDMGLGKTIQALAHLTVEKRAGRMQRPSLIVAPTSLMGNWRREAANFTPKLKVLVLQGAGRASFFDHLHEYDVVLTTYPLLPRDRDALLAQPWHYLILDEAQQIKNPRAQAAQVARALQARHRLCLTGTPMENHLGELWAQFDFLMPGFLGDQKAFNRRYRTPIEKEGADDKLERLSRRSAPFMLRRTKDQVAAELPPKTELLRVATLNSKQAALYESVRLSMEKKVRDAIAQKGLSRSHITVLDALLKLRQVCCDPRLLPKGTRGIEQAGSAKFELLFNILPEMLEEGRRILLFSQFTTMLGLIEGELKRLGIDYAKLTGQTRKRDEVIERFRSGRVSVFLISLKAGGVGLNLVEADTVIHYDPWWNPAVETQATDRAHRIGQDKPVFIYKLLTEGTVEEKILALQERKRQLAEGVYNQGRKQSDVPIDEAMIEELLASR